LAFHTNVLGEVSGFTKRLTAQPGWATFVSCGVTREDQNMPRNLPKSPMFIGLMALIVAGNMFFSTSASAEFFGCHDKPGRVLARYDGVARHQSSSRHTHEIAAQSARTRLSRVTYAGPRRYWSDRSRW
jgi:hypothetical protein